MSKRKPRIVKSNSQILDIKSSDLEKLPHRQRFDSTLEERERTYQDSKPEPRLKEYR